GAGGEAPAVSCQEGTTRLNSGMTAAHTMATESTQCRTAADCRRRTTVAAIPTRTTTDVLIAPYINGLIAILPFVLWRRGRRFALVGLPTIARRRRAAPRPPARWSRRRTLRPGAVAQISALRDEAPRART